MKDPIPPRRKCRCLIRVLHILLKYQIYFFFAFILFMPFSLGCGMFYYNYVDYDYLRDGQYLDIDKCPLCYGTSMCPLFMNGSISFQDKFSYKILDFLYRSISLKNVYPATLHRGGMKHNVILKKLAFSAEIVNSESSFCQKIQQSGLPSCNNEYKYSMYFLNSNLNASSFANISEMMFCPSQRLLDIFYENYHERIYPSDWKLLQTLYQLLFTLKINVEPIIMQVFPKKFSIKWPFPKYYGACGRFVVAENVGPTLDHFFNTSFKTRVDLAVKILEMAFLFTSNPSGFALYWVDVSYDNLAVDDAGNVVIIDLEDILIVDTQETHFHEKIVEDQIVKTKYYECENDGDCILFNSYNLCTHTLSDLNYYAVCKNLLSKYASPRGLPGGLLHDIPKNIDEEWKLSSHIEYCVDKEEKFNRFQTAATLLETLKNIYPILE